VRSFDYNDGYHVKVDEVKETEHKWRSTSRGVKNHVS
jgi:cytochrome aa3-600 menaquinol oxidase subunit I